MSQEEAVIRPYDHNDDNKLVRFMVGKAAMEPLAVANNKGTHATHPFAVKRRAQYHRSIYTLVDPLIVDCSFCRSRAVYEMVA